MSAEESRAARYRQQLSRLSDAFRSDRTLPLLRHAVIVGMENGAEEPDWHRHLQGEGVPWRTYKWPNAEATDRWQSPWRSCWMSHDQGEPLAAYRRFLQLGEEAARCHYALFGKGICDPDRTSFTAEQWMEALHRLAWRTDDVAFRARRYRLWAVPPRVILADWQDAMQCEPDARLLFPHQFLSILDGDVFTASALASELLVNAKEETPSAPLAEQVDRLVKVIGTYLDHRFVNSLRANFLQPCLPGSPAEAAQLVEVKELNDREMDAMVQVRETIPLIAPEMERFGADSTDLLKVLHFICGGGGPDNAYPLWPDLKVSLQRFAIQLRAGPVHEQNGARTLPVNAKTGGPDDSTATVGQPGTDGPEGGCWLWWQNTRYDIPKGNVYKLLAFMWDRDSASYDALIGPVFDDDVAPQTIRSLANKAGKALKRIGIPWRFSTDSVTRHISRQPTG